MRRFLLVLPLLVCLSVSARAAGAADHTDDAHTDDAGRIVLTADQIKAGGIETAPLRAIRAAPVLSAYGVVLDPGRLATAAERLAAARAGVARASAQMALAGASKARAATLFQAQGNISRARYEAAEAAARMASANLVVARAQLAARQAQDMADWGQPLAAAIAHTRAPLPALTSGRACLVQLTLPLGAALPVAPQHAKGQSSTGALLTLRLVGPSPRTAPGGGVSYFYQAPAPACPPTGATLSASVPDGAAKPGVLVPDAAVVWRGGQALVFRDEANGGFVPVPLHGAVPQPDGLFLPLGPETPLRAGQKLVVRGAGLLLSRSEIGAQPKAAKSGGDDDDD